MSPIFIERAKNKFLPSNSRYAIIPAMTQSKKPPSRAYKLKRADARNRVQNALLLAGSTMFVSYPWFYYQYKHMTLEIFSRAPTGHQLIVFAMGQSLILFAAALICSLVGFLYYDRLGLVGFGKLSDLRAWLPWALVLGILITPLLYYLADRRLMSLIPEAFPRPWPWALAWMAGSALSQEVVARFGLLSIGVYLLRWRSFKGHPWPAIAAVSVFSAFSAVIFLDRINFSARLELWQIGVLTLTIFAFQWILCEVYLRKGLLAALALHLGLSARLLIYSFLR